MDPAAGNHTGQHEDFLFKFLICRFLFNQETWPHTAHKKAVPRITGPTNTEYLGPVSSASEFRTRMNTEKSKQTAVTQRNIGLLILASQP